MGIDCGDTARFSKLAVRMSRSTLLPGNDPRVSSFDKQHV